MSKLPAIELGTFGPGPREGKPFRVDLELLIEQNLLLQANSGGGKSWALRRLIEQAYGKLPIIIIDPEGEFGSLRQKYDFLLVGKGGETPADMRSAKKLAHRLLEHRVSAVCDIYELGRARGDWVAAFLTALVAAPKELWTDVMIVVDEAHDYAPEKGHGSSPALEPMAALASKGRKRGQMLVAATQRIGKFAKDVAAELKNALVGLTWLDIDRDRAADALGISKANRPAFFEAIKIVNPGSFYGLGRALHLLDPAPLQMGRPETEHPKRGQRRTAPPPPTKAILHLLPQLGDLPKEVEQEAETEARLRAEVARLRGDLARAGKVGAAKAEAQIERVVEVVPEGMLPAASALVERTDRLLAQVDRFRGELRQEIGGMKADAVGLLKLGHRRPVARAVGANGTSSPPRVAPAPARTTPAGPSFGGDFGDGDWRPQGGALRMLKAIASSLADGLTWRQVATLARMKHSGGSFSTYKSALRTNGCVEERGELVHLTDRGRAFAGDVEAPMSGPELVAFWKQKLQGKAKLMLEVVVDQGPGGAISRADLAARVDMEASGGSFSTYLSALRSNGLVADRDGGLTAAELFFR